MQLRLRSRPEAFAFALSITAVALVGNALFILLLLPPDLSRAMLFPGSLITVVLALPISYFVGTRIVAVHELTVALEHAADHDLLTGASTRLSFYKRAKACRPAPLAVIVVDIDHFKAINDRFGHQAGDLALKWFATTLVRNCREDDIVARFGGEEFVILLQQAGLDEGNRAAERLCRRVREKPIFLNGARIQMTASFGVAELSDIKDVDVAIHQADMAVYRAKQAGRNRVCVYDPALDRQPCPIRAASNG